MVGSAAVGKGGTARSRVIVGVVEGGRLVGKGWALACLHES